MINILALSLLVILTFINSSQLSSINIGESHIHLPTELSSPWINCWLSVAFLLYGYGLRGYLKGLNSRLALLIISPMIIISLGRISWQAPGKISAVHLYWLGFFMACIAGLVSRRFVSSPETSRLFSFYHAKQAASRNYLYHLILGLVVLVAGWLYFYRLTELPLELNSFGTQAMSAADRLLHNQVSWWDLILFREMTQEECGNSLPFVLWHAMFQVLFDGLSITASRMACATATLISCWFMFRVSKHLGGMLFSVFTTATYALLPLTIYNAKLNGIFGFSSLLVLLIIDRLLVFCKYPSIGRGCLLGLCLPLGAYGIANIRLMIIATIVCSAYFIVATRARSWRSYITPSLVTIVVAGVIILPQLFNISRVQHQVRGRGEHVFGGVLTQMLVLEKNKHTRLEKTVSVLYDNALTIGKTFTPANNETLSRLPHRLAPLFIVGVALIVTQLRIAHTMFILALLVASYIAPLVAIPIYEHRLLMLNTSQALVIGYVFHLLVAIFRFNHGLTGGAIAIGSIVTMTLLAVSPITTSFFKSKNPIAEIRNRLIEDTTYRVVYICTQHETAGNFIRWNPPFLGRDSNAIHPIVIFSAEDISNIQALVEFLNAPSTIICNNTSSRRLQSSQLWTELLLTPPFRWMSFQNSNHIKPIVHAIDPWHLSSKDRVILPRLSYFSPRLFVRPIPSKGIQATFSSSIPYRRFAVLPRGARGGKISVTVSIDGKSLDVPLSHEPTSQSLVTWFSGGYLSTGTHRISVYLNEDTHNRNEALEDIIVIGIPADESFLRGAPVETH